MMAFTLEFSFISFSFVRYFMPEELYLSLSKQVFFHLEVELVLAQYLENLLQVLRMFLEHGVIHHDVVQVYNDEASRNDWRNLFIRVQKAAGVLVRRNDITRNSKDSHMVIHTVFGSSSLAMRTCQYSNRKSSLVKYQALPSWSNKSALKGIKYFFLIVILLSARQLMYIRNDLSFFF